MKNILAAVVTLLALGGAYIVFQSDTEVEKFSEINKMIAKTEVKVKLDNASMPKKVESKVSSKDVDKAQEKKRKELDEKLQALKNKAGNMAAFKVSPLYKQKCASCHGVNGAGIIGPKLIGLSSEKVYKDLIDFKTGARKNYVMYGLLNKMSNKELKSLSEEIGEFENKLKAQ